MTDKLASTPKTTAEIPKEKLVVKDTPEVSVVVIPNITKPIPIQYPRVNIDLALIRINALLGLSGMDSRQQEKFIKEINSILRNG